MTPSSRYQESRLRQLVAVLFPGESAESTLDRLKHLQRGLEPEDEFAVILSWLGNCRVVHKPGQEQLPWNSTETYRVPDLLAVFEHKGKGVPVLIEVKATEPADLSKLFHESLSLKPKYLEYSRMLGLPMLVAWRCGGVWTLFEMRHAKLATVNYKIDFESAYKENLLGLLAEDFLYHPAPVTRIRMRIKKLTQPDPETGGFEGEVIDVHFANPAGEQIPEIPLLGCLFLFWDSDAEIADDGDDIVQSFVVPEPTQAEWASRTLSRLVHATASVDPNRRQVVWHSIVHEQKHVAHDTGLMRALAEEGARYGVITGIMNVVPKSPPAFF